MDDEGISPVINGFEPKWFASFGWGRNREVDSWTISFRLRNIAPFDWSRARRASNNSRSMILSICMSSPTFIHRPIMHKCIRIPHNWKSKRWNPSRGDLLALTRTFLYTTKTRKELLQLLSSRWTGKIRYVKFGFYRSRHLESKDIRNNTELFFCSSVCYVTRKHLELECLRACLANMITIDL